MTSKKILVVDDEKPLAKALEIKLNKHGYQAKAVFGGADALNELQRELYDVLLLDLVMSDINGWQILKKVKELNLTVKVVITSNLGQQEDIKKAKELGAIDFIVKSDVTLEEIVAKIETYYE